MNRIIKFVLAAGVIAPALLAGSAFAATISNPLFSNGQTTIDANGGATVSGTFTLTVGPGEVVEWLRTQADTMPFADNSVGGLLGYQEGVYTNVPFSAKVAPNTGTYNVTEQGAGTWGGNRSINGGDSVVVGATTLGTVRVIANADGSTSAGGADQAPAWFTAFKAWVEAKLATPPAPTVSPLCTEMAQYSAGLYMGASGSQVVSLQGYLLAKDPNSIPLIRDGAAKFGYYGAQTSAAVASFKAAHSCN